LFATFDSSREGFNAASEAGKLAQASGASFQNKSTGTLSKRRGHLILSSEPRRRLRASAAINYGEVSQRALDDLIEELKKADCAAF
jgi:hypothetical protein